jgi:hypothetical protein
MRHIRDYVSPKALITGLLLAAITSVGGTVWASLAKPTSRWFWADAEISRGGALIWALVTLVAAVVVCLLATMLRRTTRALVLEQERKPTTAGAAPVASPTVDANGLDRTPLLFDALAMLLDNDGRWTNLNQMERTLLPEIIRRASGTMPLAPRAQIARVMDAAVHAGIVRTDMIHGYLITPQGRNWALDEIEKGQSEGSRFAHLRGS